MQIIINFISNQLFIQIIVNNPSYLALFSIYYNDDWLIDNEIEDNNDSNPSHLALFSTYYNGYLLIANVSNISYWLIIYRLQLFLSINLFSALIISGVYQYHHIILSRIIYIYISI